MKSSHSFGAAILGVVLLLPVAVPAQTVVAKKGTVVYGSLQQSLDSKTSHNGDQFTLTEHDTLFHHNPELRGGVIEGHVENVSPAGPTHKASMAVILDDIKLPDGSVSPIHATIISAKAFEPKHHLFRDAGVIVGSAVAGHIVAKKMGKAHGGLAGGAAGFALVSTMKSDIRLKRGTVIKMKLTDDAVAAAQQ